MPMTRKTSPSVALPAARTAFGRALLEWFDAHQRNLPWREAPSLYKTVVSEFMLQQTQVKTVLPYFARWLEALPDFKALAAAPQAQVLKLWEGLGYYSRARNLHRVGQAIAAMKTIPREAAAWRELPGIGPYTAAAITSIAFGSAEACVDGNVVRILARLTANGTEFRDSASASKVFAPLAQEIVSAERPDDHNQAMMELGATVCYRTSPSCTVCPVYDWCAAGKAGNPENYPRLAPKLIEKKEVIRVWCERKGSLLLHLAPAGAKRFALIHELPTAEQVGLTPSAAATGALLAKAKRAITRFQITESIHELPAPKGELPTGLVWIGLSDVPKISLSGPHRRWIEALLAKRR